MRRVDSGCRARRALCLRPGCSAPGRGRRRARSCCRSRSIRPIRTPPGSTAASTSAATRASRSSRPPAGRSRSPAPSRGAASRVTILTADGWSVTLTQLGSIAVAKGATVAEGDGVGTIGPSGDPEVGDPYVQLGVRHRRPRSRATSTRSALLPARGSDGPSAVGRPCRRPRLPPATPDDRRAPPPQPRRAGRPAAGRARAPRRRLRPLRPTPPSVADGPVRGARPRPRLATPPPVRRGRVGRPTPAHATPRRSAAHARRHRRVETARPRRVRAGSGAAASRDAVAAIQRVDGRARRGPPALATLGRLALRCSIALHARPCRDRPARDRATTRGRRARSPHPPDARRRHSAPDAAQARRRRRRPRRRRAARPQSHRSTGGRTVPPRRAGRSTPRTARPASSCRAGSPLGVCRWPCSPASVPDAARACAAAGAVQTRSYDCRRWRTGGGRSWWRRPGRMRRGTGTLATWRASASRRTCSPATTGSRATTSSW